MPLVEVCGGPETSRDVVDWTVAQLREAGKSPVVVGMEIDGFIGNRMQFALLREALALWSEGVASAAAIDTAVRRGGGEKPVGLSLVDRRLVRAGFSDHYVH